MSPNELMVTHEPHADRKRTKMIYIKFSKHQISHLLTMCTVKINNIKFHVFIGVAMRQTIPSVPCGCWTINKTMEYFTNNGINSYNHKTNHDNNHKSQ